MQVLMKLLLCGTDSPLLYVYNSWERTAKRPPPGVVPWPVEFITTAFHKKHLFAQRRLPTAESISSRIAHWSSKTRWRLWHEMQANLGPDVDDNGEEHWRLRSRKPVALCPHRLDEHTEAFINGVSASASEF